MSRFVMMPSSHVKYDFTWPSSSTCSIMSMIARCSRCGCTLSLSGGRSCVNERRSSHTKTKLGFVTSLRARKERCNRANHTM